MVSKKLVKALNEHINLEMYSGYLYLAMSIRKLQRLFFMAL